MTVFVTNNLLINVGLSAKVDKADKNQQLPSAPYLISVGSSLSKNISGFLLRSLII